MGRVTLRKRGARAQHVRLFDTRHRAALGGRYLVAGDCRHPPDLASANRGVLRRSWLPSFVSNIWPRRPPRMATPPLDHYKDIDAQIDQLLQCKPLSEAEVQALCVKAQGIFVEESNVQPVKCPVTVRIMRQLLFSDGKRTLGDDMPRDAQVTRTFLHWRSLTLAGCVVASPATSHGNHRRTVLPPHPRFAATFMASSRTWWSCSGSVGTAQTLTTSSWATMWTAAITLWRRPRS